MIKNSIWDQETKYFYALTPEVIDNSLVIRGMRPSGRVFALNSLENRVYEVEINRHSILQEPFSTESVITKFYRPGRWSREAIKEEHAFLLELSAQEIPVIAPLVFDGETLFECPLTGFYHAHFPKIRGRLKDELNIEELSWIGRLVGRIHNVGSSHKFNHRPLFHPQNYISAHFDHLSKAEFLPTTTVKHYIMVAEQLSKLIAPLFNADNNNFTNQCIHGDLHRGNILWTVDGPWVVDLDDCAIGPREQDLWLLLPGRDEYSLKDQEIFLDAYLSISKEGIYLNRFIIEALRSIRMIHFNGWIAKRWADPVFKKIYSSFDSQSYWETQLLDLKEQLSHIQDAS
ncbi:MAG: serine/threonine protein kinase [Oligoflexia bacterium]|nr:serine/threonine protein kinase [Oligoflexia bacterium]